MEYAKRKASTMRGALLGLALLSAGCQHGTPGSVEPRAETTVKVQNRNFLDMNVFVLVGSQRIRLGMVSGLSTQVLKIPDYIARSSPLRFEVHGIGGRSNPRSETISVQPGDEVELTIPPM
jgi:hypothetical protein